MAADSRLYGAIKLSPVNKYHKSKESVDKGHHGKEYELEIAEFLLKRIFDMKYSDFLFTREKLGLGKFDDLAYIYNTGDGNWNYSVVQVKHLSDITYKLSYESLAEQKGYFLLPKYFEYYKESMMTIAKDPDFAGAKLEYLIICTNVGIVQDLKVINKIPYTSNPAFKNSGSLFKLNISNTEKLNIFPDSYLSERDKLAKELAYYLILYKDIDMNCLKNDDHASMLKVYHVAIAKEVLDVKTKKLKPEFLEITDAINPVGKFCQSLKKFVSELYADCLSLTPDELRTKFKIKTKKAEEVHQRLSKYNTMNSVDEFLKEISLNLRSNFGDRELFPEDTLQLPQQDLNTSNVDEEIDDFLDKLILALDQSKNGKIISKELKDEIFNPYHKIMNQWYHMGSEEVERGSSVRNRQWITKNNIVCEAMNSMHTFQGRKLHLNQLVSDIDFLKPSILMRTFCSLSFRIGNEISEMGEIKNYYINRSLIQFNEIDKKMFRTIKEDIFLLSPASVDDEDELEIDIQKVTGNWEHLKNEEIIEAQNKSQFIITNYKFGANDFNRFVETYPADVNIHWLKYKKPCIFWHNCTKGSLSRLKTYFSMRVVSENDLHNDSFVILTGEPGMGKSTLVDHMLENFANTESKKDFPKWIIKIMLKDCVERLDEVDSLNNLEMIVKFLSFFECKENEFAKSLLERFLSKEDRVILLLDGYDELNEEKAIEKVSELLSFLRDNALVNKIVITSRPHFKEKLENILGVVSHSIKEITEEEQIYFLVNFWKQTLNDSEDNIEIRARELVSYFNGQLKASNSSEQEKGFLGIPLQTYMCAVIFKDYLSREITQLTDTLTVNSLFEKFLDQKYNIYLLKTGENLKKNYGKQKGQRIFYEEMHQDFALTSEGLVSSEERKSLPPVRNYIDFYLLLDIGIIYQSNNMYYFTHKTFAEYLLGKRFADVSNKLEIYSAKCQQAIEKALTNPGNEFILYIFDLKLTENFGLHKAALNGDQGAIEVLEMDKVNTQDCLGRPLLYYAIQYRRFDIIDVLKEKDAEVDMNNPFVAYAFRGYLNEFYRTNRINIMLEECTVEFLMRHTKLTTYAMHRDDVEYSSNLINSFDIWLETKTKNWEVVENVIRRGYTNNLIPAFQSALKLKAPLTLINLMFDKIPDNKTIPRQEFGLKVNYFVVLQYYFELDEETAQSLLQNYGRSIIYKLIYDMKKQGGIGLNPYEAIFKVYFNLFDITFLYTFSDIINNLENKAVLLTIIIKLLMEYRLPYIKCTSEKKYQMRASEDMDFLVTTHLSSWGVENSNLSFFDLNRMSNLSDKQRVIIDVLQRYKEMGVTYSPTSTIKEIILQICDHILNSGSKLIRLSDEFKDAYSNNKSDKVKECLEKAEELGYLKALLNSRFPVHSFLSTESTILIASYEYGMDNESTENSQPEDEEQHRKDCVIL